jgi:hypothetical protein
MLAPASRERSLPFCRPLLWSAGKVVEQERKQNVHKLTAESLSFQLGNDSFTGAGYAAYFLVRVAVS